MCQEGEYLWNINRILMIILHKFSRAQAFEVTSLSAREEQILSV